MQNAQNHTRWYAPHHFVFYPVVFFLMGASVYMALHRPEDKLVWSLFTVALFIITANSFMMRQHYALVLQNRLVCQEVRSRYFELSGERFAALEEQLGFGKIAALRFASDGELVALAKRAVAEKMDSKAIKEAIQVWKPDNKRV